MGVGIALSTNALLKKPNPNKWDIFKKIFVRSVKMFIIGIMLNSRFGVKLVDLRIMGVMQRIGICYFVTASIELVFFREFKESAADDEERRKSWKYYLNDIIAPWRQWLAMSALLLIWFLVVFLVDVPDCGRGYFGPGGLDGYGKYAKCIGGATGYIDELILGRSHLYSRPTPAKIYKTAEPFDPEGIMGSISSILLTFLGVQAGRILFFYDKRQYLHIVKWLAWSVVCLILFFALTQADMTNGWIPANKNLWTPTFTLLTASSAFLLLALFYFLIDVKSIWTGNPFIYPGMNSIIIYCSHSLFKYVLPCQWLVANTHAAQFYMALWGMIYWILISIYLFHKKIFYNL